ncbi:MAG TPA: ThuA domain-containing protein [Tepidisphaeraceae bacterium]|jgi:hypothetical protein|nr:ThuA domain-containing protein [Tepidisphaeraceae bacterium]
MPTFRAINRRDLLKSAGAAAAAVTLSPFLSGALLAEDAATGPKKKILFFTKSAGYQHSTITRKSPNELAYAEKLLTDFGAKNGFEVTCSKDGSLFKPDYLAKFDALAFYTTGDLTKDSDKYKMVKKMGADGKPEKDKNGRDIEEKGEIMSKEPGMGAAGKAAFLEAIKNGLGFMAFHSGSDTFHGKHGNYKAGEMLRDQDAGGKDEFDPYIQMLGGEFIIHGAQQPAVLKCVDPKFPGAEAFNNASFVEEWYSLKNFAPDLHVILTQHCDSMKGPMYQRQPYPETWARMDGKGRVFYTSMGHREDVWAKPEFQGLVLGAMRWITRGVDVDVAPNIKQVTPEADPKQWK